MKRILLTLVALVATAAATFAADLSQVWDQIKSNQSYMTVDVPAEKAKEEGFRSLTVALNSAPTTNDILTAKRLFATIDAKQQLTSVSQEGVDVSIYSAPADTNGTLYKVLFLIAANGEEKALIVLYGTCTPDAMSRALQNMSIEDIIGG